MFNVRFGATRIGAGWSTAIVAVVCLLAGCVDAPQQQAAQPAPPAAAPAPVVPAAPPAPVGPLTWRVKRGDTLGRIAQNSHCSVQDLAAWNGLKTSSRVRIGQVLKIVSPEQAAAAASAAANAAAGSGGASPANPQLERQVASELDQRAQSVRLTWPAQGAVVASFQPGETRGIEIAGHAGDPVRAAADGKVVFAGTGLNGYGSLIIVQHNKDFLTAYSHNRRLLVKMGDIVRQGQTIAEMGDEASPRVAVLFEVRHDGMPVDPMPYLSGTRG